MSFIDLDNGKLKIVFTDYGKRKLLSGNLDITYFGLSDDDVNYELVNKPIIIPDVSGTNDGSKYNDIRYKIFTE